MRVNLYEKLSRHFGFKQFRPGQFRAINAALQGRDVIVIMPTGSGKSLCYQLPGIELTGVTLVVSPLIALMKDQVDHLKEQGIRAISINSTLSSSEIREAEAMIVSGKTDFVFTTPERVATPEFRELLRGCTIDLFVVDEAHCVSQWGHSFRPDYLSLGAAIDELGRPPVLAMTATATEEILSDIVRELRMVDAETVHTGFDRPNLHLRVLATESESQKESSLTSVIPESGAGIVYCATTGITDRVSDLLSRKGRRVASYHGRMSAKRRTEAQESFMSDDVDIMVATNAFGMGIDKADIRFVVHYHLPVSIEAYYQECGRAGRDGLPSTCIAFHTPEDRKLQRFLKSGGYPDESDLVNAYHALKLVDERCELPTAEQLFAASPLSKSRMKVCLALFENKGIVQREKRNSYLMVKKEMSRDELAAVGHSYRLREERETIRQRRVEEFAETQDCRWSFLLDYFDETESSRNQCGRCDNCV